MSIQKELSDIITSGSKLKISERLALKSAEIRITALEKALNALVNADSNWPMSVSDDDEKLIAYLLGEMGDL